MLIGRCNIYVTWFNMKESFSNFKLCDTIDNSVYLKYSIFSLLHALYFCLKKFEIDLEKNDQV